MSDPPATFLRAEQALVQAARSHPNDADAALRLALLYHDHGRPADAVPHYQNVLRLRPQDADALCQLGNALAHLGRPDDALDCYRRAVVARPGHAEALTNLGVALAQRGQLAEATALMGSPLKGRTVLLWCEQGLGDAIQFARYAALVKAKGGRVVLECPEPLLRLLHTLPGIDELVTEGASLPPFDCHAPLMSLPALLGTTLAGVPADVPYLTADAGLVEAWGRRLKPVKGFKVGIAWQGNPHHKWDRWRSVPLARFAVLTEVPRVRLIALQHGPGVEQLAALKGRFAVTQPGKEFGAGGALADTAAVMASLDLVVTVDTATAHLAGALGVPVWVPLPTLVDWRWLLGRDDSPWYPTLRLFRQKVLGDWGPVFERMATELRKRSAVRPAP